jgi:uncharacterized lipoprotein YmbA
MRSTSEVCPSNVESVFLRILRSSLLCFTAMAGLSACGTSPPERFFTLAADPPPASTATQSAPAFSIIVGPVTIPEIVDRPQFVLRSSPNRVEIAELVRWAAPLKSEIPRVVADHLARLLEGSRPSTSAQRATGVPDYRVLIDVQRFESAPGESATIHALWEVRGKTGAPVAGRSAISEPAAAGYDDLVAAHSRALAALSRDIAAAIAGLRAAPAQ